MFRVRAEGVSVAVEIWAVPPAGLGEILLREPPGLCVGKVKLASGEVVLGVLAEAILCEQQRRSPNSAAGAATWRRRFKSRNFNPKNNL